MTHRRRNHSFRSERGQAAVEFALVAPILIALLLAIVQAGVAFNHYLAVTDAARAAARKAVTARLAGLTTTDIQNAAYSAAADLDSTKVGVAIADPTDPGFAQAGSTLTVTVTYPYSIDILGMTVASGDLTSRMTERLE